MRLGASLGRIRKVLRFNRAVIISDMEIESVDLSKVVHFFFYYEMLKLSWIVEMRTSKIFL